METRDIKEERDSISKALSERLEAHDESRKAAQEKIHETYEGLRVQIKDIEGKNNSELEDKFKTEDNRLQIALNELRSEESDELPKAIQKAKAALLVAQSYEVVERNFDENEDDGQKDRIPSLCELKTERKISSLKHINFEKRKPRSLISSFTEKGELSLSFAFFDEDEAEILKEVGSPFEVEVKVWAKSNGEDTSRTLTKELTLGSGDEPICLRSTFTASTAHSLKMRIVHQEMNTQWSDEAEFTTPEFEECCAWKECPDYVDFERKYSVDEDNPKIATKIGDGYGWCTIIGNTAFSPNTVTSWNIKLLKSEDNGGGIFIGVALFCCGKRACDLLAYTAPRRVGLVGRFVAEVVELGLHLLHVAVVLGQPLLERKEQPVQLHHFPFLRFTSFFLSIF